MNPVLLYVLVVVFVATLVRSAFGFGEALLAVPLLALRIPIEVAAPLAVLVSITVAAVVVAQDWRKIHFSSAGWLVFSTLFGIPLGLALLTRADARIVKAVLAVIIVAFSAYSLAGMTKLELKSDNRLWLVGCGLCGGILGGGLWHERATAGGLRGLAPLVRPAFPGHPARIFPPASLVSMGGYWLAGLWVPPMTRYYLWSLPLMLGAILLGRALNRRLAAETFLKCAYVGLIGIGALLLAQALHG